MAEPPAPEIGADYQEITPPAAGPTTGHFALDVWLAGATPSLNLGSVLIIPNAGLNAATLTTTPLGAGATFTSAAFDFNNSVLGFANAMAFSDQPSANNGFIILQGITAANMDLNSAVATVVANTGQGIKAAQVVRFCKISYTNDATPQGVFRLGSRFTIS